MQMWPTRIKPLKISPAAAASPQAEVLCLLAADSTDVSTAASESKRHGVPTVPGGGLSPGAGQPLGPQLLILGLCWGSRSSWGASATA